MTVIALLPGAVQWSVVDLALTCLPALPRSVSIVAIALALLGVLRFTGWYAERERSFPASQ